MSQNNNNNPPTTPPSDNSDNNNTDYTTAAEPYSPSAANAAKHRYLEERLIARMRRLQMVGANYDQICETLHISRATLYRYIKKMANQDRVYMQQKFEDVLIVEINWLWNALKETYTICRTIEHSRDADVVERLEAAKLKNEVAIASVKLLREGARTTLAEMPTETKEKVLTTAGGGPPITTTVGGTVEVPATALIPLPIQEQIEFVEMVEQGNEQQQQKRRKKQQQQQQQKGKKKQRSR